MATVPDPSYISAAEVKAQTSIMNLAALQPEEITKIIQRAEDHVDAYCGRQEHHPDDENTDRVFPRSFDTDTNGDPEIPYQVSRATLAQVEWLYVQWWGVSETTQTPVEHEVKSLRMGGDGSYGEERTGDGKDFAAATLCAQAKSYLTGFRNRFRQIGTPDPICDPVVA